MLDLSLFQAYFGGGGLGLYLGHFGLLVGGFWIWRYILRVFISGLLYHLI